MGSESKRLRELRERHQRWLERRRKNIVKSESAERAEPSGEAAQS